MNKILACALGASLALAACGGGSNSNPAAGSAPAQAQAIVTHGTITGFGSVIVEGVHYDTTRASFSIDGNSAGRQDDLSAGQRVTIRGTVDDRGAHVAQEVEYEAELHGTVSAVNAAGNSFQALGQTIRVDDSTVFRGLTDLTVLAVGDAVEISGSRAADQSILASYVERETAQSEAELKGAISALDTTARRFTIGSQIVDYSGATFSPSGFVAVNGAFVEIRGSLQSGVLAATRIRHDDDFNQASSGTETEFEGLISNLASDRSSFQIDATLVRVNSSTVYQGGTAATLASGIKVEAEGTIQADGSLQARKVQFKNASAATGGSIDGAVSAIDRTARTFTLLGVAIAIADSTVFRDSRDNNRTFTFDNLTVGDYIEVAFMRSGSVLTATKLERKSNDTRSVIKAGLDSFNEAGRSLIVAGVRVDTTSSSYSIDDTSVTASQFYAALSAGSKIRARGPFSGSTLAASEVELDRDD